MGDKTGIEWTDATWNPIRGCSRVSEGCRNCYAERVAMRFSRPGVPYEGLVRVDSQGKPQGWSGDVRFVEERLLDPLRWKRPRRIFVNSMSDLFHENVTDAMRDRIFAVMALCPQHTFQVLTKRPERMMAYLQGCDVDRKNFSKFIHNPRAWKIWGAAAEFTSERHMCPFGWREFDENDWVDPWPLPNVWLGVSVEDQKTADARIPLLLQTPVAVRFLSCEPLLWSVGVGQYLSDMEGGFGVQMLHGIDWVICGGESGREARPMHPDWVRVLRDQCVAAGVPFFFKQWGEWAPTGPLAAPQLSVCRVDGWSGQCTHAALEAHYFEAHAGEAPSPPWQAMYRVGKKAAGHLLDGQVWQQMPVAVGEGLG